MSASTASWMARRPPIVMLHGGPGSSHWYFLNATALAGERAVILYDQLDSGRSETPGDARNWQVPRFIAELEAIRNFPRIEALACAWRQLGRHGGAGIWRAGAGGAGRAGAAITVGLDRCLACGRPHPEGPHAGADPRPARSLRHAGGRSAGRLRPRHRGLLCPPCPHAHAAGGDRGVQGSAAAQFLARYLQLHVGAGGVHVDRNAEEL